MSDSVSTPLSTPKSSQSSGLHALRGTILQRALQIAFVAAGLGYLWSAIELLRTHQYLYLSLLTLGLLWVAAGVFIERIPGFVRVITLLGTLGTIGILELLYRGPLSTAWLWLTALILMAYAFWGNRTSIFLFILSLLGAGGLGLAQSLSWVVLPSNAPITQDPVSWIVALTAYALVVGLLTASYGVAQSELYRALQEEKALTHTLEAERATLELRIEQRTRDLQRHRSYLEVATLIARELSLESDQDELFKTTLDLIRRHLGFYHAGIFLLDEEKEYAVLRAASSEAGQRMIEAGHRLKKGEEGIVGYVVATGEARIALDVGKDAVHFRNPYLPDTHSEIALPIKVGQEIVGALDIQSTEVGAFSEQDVQVFQTIADQLGIAMERKRLIDQMQSYTTELETRYRQMVRQQWRDYLMASRHPHGYRWHANRLEALTHPTPETLQEADQNRPQVKPEGEALQTLYLPIRARGETVGVLTVKIASEIIPDEIIRLLNSIAERIGLALENARLLEMVRVRAEREHLVSELGTKVRSATDVDSILRAAATEIGRMFGVSEVLVQLRNDEYPFEERQAGGGTS
jgi:GAF domain-containing protein